jgi:hypothetical protein
MFLGAQPGFGQQGLGIRQQLFVAGLDGRNGFIVKIVRDGYQQTHFVPALLERNRTLLEPGKEPVQGLFMKKDVFLHESFRALMVSVTSIVVIH